MAETPRFAHLITLLFLGTAFVVLCSLLVAVVAAIAKARTMAKCAAGLAALAIFGYAGLLLTVGLVSRNKTLLAGGWKYFCEADCHIAYSVDGVSEAATLGPEAKPVSAHGRFMVVRLKTWFDEKSIASFRGDAPLTPDSRTVELIDGADRRYAPLQPVPAGIEARSTSLRTPLRPGESYETVFVFDLPDHATDPRLLITDAEPITALLIDDENSPLHGKIFLGLNPGPAHSAASFR